ncbi:pilus assembly protein [Bordetella ansorpii]|uniref:Pilus assembly protein n=1 Tax=Bordetella ansorpii TaxID=288768 RepID=A0A157SNT2_9BORD|nr:type II secretion system F family protein [Bordetella ansorpii]SAI71944.1 pilus assembly protein [Bordetella ansorpii]
MLLALAMGLAALCAGLAVYALCMPLWRGDRAPRTDPVLPWWWRGAWPWTSWLARLGGPLLSWRARSRWSRLKGRAGLPAQVAETDLAALAWLASLAAAALAAAVALRLGADPLVPAIASAIVAGLWPRLWLRRLATRRRLRIDRDMPFVLDLMTLCVEAGLGLHGALQQSAQCAPAGPLRDMLEGALADMRAGMGRAAALKAMAARAGSTALQAWVAALAQADSLGMSLGPLMRGQAAQCRSDRFQRAERLAMEAPVKMLLPLIGCIFPCTFIVLGFPILMQLLPALG